MAALIDEANTLQEIPREAVIPDEPDNLESIVFSKLSSFINNITDYDHKYAEMLRPHDDSEETLRAFSSLIYTLKTLQSHFIFVQKVLKANNQQEIHIIKQELNIIAKHYIKVNLKTDLTLYTINYGLDTVLKAVFEDLEGITNGFYHGKNPIKKHKKTKRNIFRMRVITSKLECVIEYFPGLVTLPKDDLFSQARSSPIWENIYKDVHFRDFVDRAKVHSSLSPFLHMLTVTYAMINKMETVGEERNNKTFGQIIGFLSGAYYLAMKGEARLQASLFYAKSDMDLAFKVWNMPEKKPIRNMWKMILPSIKSDKKIYLPRLFPAITKETILQEYREGTLNRINNSTLHAPALTGKREEILETIFVKDTEKVQVRIISPYPLVIKKRPENKLNIASNCSKNRHIEKFNGVVIHIHGGGFVAMSSASHRNYLYQWAKSLNMVVFSIDYRLAPKDPYPAALDDVWQGYNWLINYSESVLGIPLDRIVLAGDSAGGNLVAALTLRAIKEGIRIPDGCLLAYPALNLYPLKVVPSYFLSLEDIILPYSFLKLCVKAYVPEDCHPDSDPFLSPIVASDELLARFPPVRIITGTGDPLHDDNWKLLHRLQNLNKNVKMTVYDGMPHGFLAMAPMAAWELIIAESVGRIRELFYSMDGSGLKISDFSKRETSDTL